MPLRDHFHPPLKDGCPWTSFHSNWAVKMVDRLNPMIRSRGYRSLSEVHLGTQVEVDVATFEQDRSPGLFDPHGGNGSEGGGVAVAAEVYAPPVPVLTGEVSFAEPDLFEVKVYRGGGAWALVAAVELVSPSNKDREETRRAFAVKCAAYLQKGVSVVVVDAVTESDANLHGELRDLLDLPPAFEWASPTGLSVVAYRTVKRVGKDGERVRLDAWPNQLAIGEPLPTVPLWLAPGLAVPLELELTYTAACQSLAID
jgi:hypothetical protein